jgi:hypothetical protein
MNLRVSLSIALVVILRVRLKVRLRVNLRMNLRVSQRVSLRGDPKGSQVKHFWVTLYCVLLGKALRLTYKCKSRVFVRAGKKHSSLSLKTVFSTKYILLRKSNRPLLDEEISTWDRIIETVS